MIARLNMGGPAHQAALLSGRRFDPERFETLLAHGSLPAGESSAEYLAAREGATRVYVPELVQPLSPLDDARAYANLVRLIRRFRPHIVHTHTAKAGFLGRAAALSSFGPGGPRPKLVHTFHGHVLEGYFGLARSRAYVALERALATRTDLLIGVSDATIADLVRLRIAEPDRFRRVPLGLDLEPISSPPAGLRAATRTEIGAAEGDVVCIYVGRIVPIKRLDRLIDAFAEVTREGQSPRLLVVGDGEERGALERRAAERGLGGRVDFLGYRSDLAGLFAAADLAVLSSDNEGTPVSLIEGAAAGRPAVATDVGGVAEVVRPETGILVEREDRAGLAAAIARLAADGELRARMGESAREHVLARYGAARLTADVTRIYDELLARGV